jgi:hypothetical protein
MLFGQLHERTVSSFQILNPQVCRTEYLRVRSTRRLEEEMEIEKDIKRGEGEDERKV